MTINMIETLMNIAIAERAKASMNLRVYLSNSVAVGEHPDVVEEANKLVAALADANGKIDVLSKMVEEIKSSDASEDKA